MPNETHAGREARARQDATPTENVDDGTSAETDTRVPCFYCGNDATGYDEQKGVDVCDACDSLPPVTDAEAVRRACALAPGDARYVMVCFDCRSSKTSVQNTEAVERARTDDRAYPCDCGGEYELIIDAATDSTVRLGGLDADPADGIPRCRRCGDVIVVRSGPAYERCVECLLAGLAAAEGEGEESGR